MELIIAIGNKRETAALQFSDYDAGAIHLLKSLAKRLTQLAAKKVSVADVTRKAKDD